MRRVVAICLVLVALACAAPAGAISYGEPAPEYTNVGLLVAVFDSELGEVPVPFCSGTLIDANTFLTAAHCFPDFADIAEQFPDFDGYAGFFVTFAPQFDPSDPTMVLIPGTPHLHPDFPGPMADAKDIAVMELTGVPSGIVPAEVAPLGYLDQVDRSDTFTAVGYGAVRETRRQAHQSLLPPGERLKADQTMRSVTQAWLNLSMNQATGDGGTCYGDSGGPHFHGGVVVSLTVTGDRWCKAADKTYRIDTVVAQEFLRPFLAG